LRRLAAILLALSVAAEAVAQGIPPSQKALLLLRVLTYDRNLKSRAKQEVRIAVVYLPGHAASERERDALLLAIEAIAGRAVVAGLPVRAAALPYQDAAGFRTRLGQSGAAALYVCAGLEEATRDLARAAKELSVLAICGSRDQVVKGLAVGLGGSGRQGRARRQLAGRRGPGSRPGFGPPVGGRAGRVGRVGSRAQFGTRTSRATRVTPHLDGHRSAGFEAKKQPRRGASEALGLGEPPRPRRRGGTCEVPERGARGYAEKRASSTAANGGAGRAKK
jgi:hypothetical protein